MSKKINLVRSSRSLSKLCILTLIVSIFHGLLWSFLNDYRTGVKPPIRKQTQGAKGIIAKQEQITLKQKISLYLYQLDFNSSMNVLPECIIKFIDPDYGPK